MTKAFDSKRLPVDFRVQVEPALQDEIQGKTPEELAALARVFYRWAKQLWVLEAALRRDGVPPTAPPTGRRLPCLRPKAVGWRN